MNKIIQFLRVFSLMVILLAMPTGEAFAALRSCRTDPIFKLSNGDILTVTLEIGTDAANVKNVIYVLHVPAGVKVTQVVFTDGGIGRKEIYRVYQDSPANTYTTDTVVTTLNTGTVTVTAYTRLNGVATKSATGYNGQHLITTISRP
jgi:hypothetical protein